MEVEPLETGAAAPNFELPGIDGETYTLDDFDAHVLVVIFMSNRCPLSRSYEERIIALQDDYEAVEVVAINANDAEKWPESLEEMAERAEDQGYNFPYLKDESQDVVTAFGAECTPQAFVLDEDRHLVYQGAIDDDMDGRNVSEPYVRDAIEATLEGEPVGVETVSPMGCGIKWKFEQASS